MQGIHWLSNARNHYKLNKIEKKLVRLASVEQNDSVLFLGFENEMLRENYQREFHAIIKVMPRKQAMADFVCAKQRSVYGAALDFNPDRSQPFQLVVCDLNALENFEEMIPWCERFTRDGGQLIFLLPKTHLLFLNRVQKKKILRLLGEDYMDEWVSWFGSSGGNILSVWKYSKRMQQLLHTRELAAE